MAKGFVGRLAAASSFATLPISPRTRTSPPASTRRIGCGKRLAVRLLVRFAGAADYSPRLRCFSVARKTVEARLPEPFGRAFLRAFSTRRP